MSNNLSPEKQASVVHSLAEGASIRSIERMTGIHRDTVMRLGLRVGEGCAAVMDSTMRNLECRLIQMDEIWGFVGCKKKNATKSERADGFGDAYTFVAIDVESRMVPAFLVGKRDPEATQAFIDDLASRLNGRPQISSDAFRPYRQAVEAGFAGNVDYGQVVKVYSKPKHYTLGHYSPPKLVAVRRVAKIGEPQKDLISTSYAERQNLTMRMHMRRLTRLTNGFSKKIENFRAAVALHFGYYNFCRVHKSLRQTPAMAGGVTNHVWTVPELLEAAK
jgi:IS1 family transposase